MQCKNCNMTARILRYATTFSGMVCEECTKGAGLDNCTMCYSVTKMVPNKEPKRCESCDSRSRITTSADGRSCTINPQGSTCSGNSNTSTTSSYAAKPPQRFFPANKITTVVEPAKVETPHAHYSLGEVCVQLAYRGDGLTMEPFGKGELSEADDYKTLRLEIWKLCKNGKYKLLRGGSQMTYVYEDTPKEEQEALCKYVMDRVYFAAVNNSVEMLAEQMARINVEYLRPTNELIGKDLRTRESEPEKESVPTSMLGAVANAVVNSMVGA